MRLHCVRFFSKHILAEYTVHIVVLDFEYGWQWWCISFVHLGCMITKQRIHKNGNFQTFEKFDSSRDTLKFCHFLEKYKYLHKYVTNLNFCRRTLLYSWVKK